VARDRLRKLGQKRDVVSTMEKFSAERAAEIMRKARENMRPMEISPAPLPPSEDRLARHRREIAAQQAAEHAEQDASEVAALRAEVDDLRADLLNLARATRECMDGIHDVNDERAATLATLREKIGQEVDQLHALRLEVANVRSDLAQLKLAMADQRAAKAAVLDLPDAPRRLQ
jgi:predicted DNA-binding ribbon-helix-helix protein